MSGGAKMADPETAGASGTRAAAPGAGLSEDEQMARLLKNNRYVDQDGRPLAADATAPFAEFKMMPIYMKLGVDQRDLPKVLAECANSNMPVVVRRVAIRPDESQPLDLASLTRDCAAVGRMPCEGVMERVHPRGDDPGYIPASRQEQARPCRHRGRRRRRPRLDRGRLPGRDGRRDPRDHLHFQSSTDWPDSDRPDSDWTGSRLAQHRRRRHPTCGNTDGIGNTGPGAVAPGRSPVEGRGPGEDVR